MPDQADTYKCFATNEYGQAMVTVILNVIEGEHSANNNVHNPACCPQLQLTWIQICLLQIKSLINTLLT